MRHTTRFIIAAAAVVMLLGSCAKSPSAPSGVSSPGNATGNSGGTGGGTATGSLVFTASPLDLTTIRQIVPLGNLNPPGHTLPTDHIYLNTRLTATPLPAQPVVVPGDGVVQFIIQRSEDAKIGVRRGALTYYLDHIVLDSSLREGASVIAGQRLGLTNPAVYGIDLGVINEGLTVTFLSPARYASESLHGDAPLRYFDEPLRSQMYSLVNCTDANKDGRFNFDIAGRLSGNWFHESLSPGDSAGSGGWARHLAFVRDNIDPSQVRISVGGVLSQMGVFAVDPAAPDPSDVDVSSGLVIYRLYRGGGLASPAAVMLVQMLDPSRLRVEIVGAVSSSTPAFSAAAQVYVR